MSSSPPSVYTVMAQYEHDCNSCVNAVKLPKELIEAGFKVVSRQKDLWIMVANPNIQITFDLKNKFYMPIGPITKEVHKGIQKFIKQLKW